MNENTSSANRLATETSPYLQQHAQNPVDWYPWGEEALEKAKREEKPILLSIGYSSCHWCHVMAHESFEDTAVANLMNKYFVNIKLDREERPDIDQIYMDAIQAMGLRGGWPLNVFLTADQKPFYGGTYFPKEQWKKLLSGIHEAYTQNYDKLYESASQFAEAVSESEAEKYGLGKNVLFLEQEAFDSIFKSLSVNFDAKWGGFERSPKFPMPTIWQFLAHYHSVSKSNNAREHLLFTLDQMAAGGIYDQIGGGFARYSVDGQWHVPHFEKMLYDNGQLLSLYATGYRLSTKPHYLNVLQGTAKWLQREMMHESGGFYSALDADSEGEEGKYYVWSSEEVKELAREDFNLIAEYYDISREGNWEGTNVLRRLTQEENLADDLGISTQQLRETVTAFNQKALAYRVERVAPGRDDKIIAGWNGLALTGLCEAYQATGDSLFLELAQKNANFTQSELVSKNGLMRLYGSSLPGYLEDYAAVIEGFIVYYETTFDESSLQLALELTEQAIEQFYDQEEGLFFYTSNKAEVLIARKKELFDNVIPSSNAMMARNLLKLGTMMDREELKAMAAKMVTQVNPLVTRVPNDLSHWAATSMMLARPVAEVLIVGPVAKEFGNKLQLHYLPSKVVMAVTEKSNLPLFAHKEMINSQTTIYVCANKTCRQPVFDVESALQEISAIQ